MLRKFSFVFVVSCLTAAAFGLLQGAAGQSSADAKKSLDLRTGEHIFTNQCQQCHAVYQGQYSFGPNLFHETKPHPRKTPAEIRAILKNGKGKMPAFNDKLSREEMDDLIAYVRSL